ncbi:unnamed protein product [Sympodiomycopsis kandeliae]
MTTSSRRLARTLFVRVPHFQPSSVLHSLAILHRLATTCSHVGGGSEKGIVGFHFHRDKLHSSRLENYGTLTLSSSSLTSKLYNHSLGSLRIPLPSQESDYNTSIKQIAPLIGLRMSRSIHGTEGYLQSELKSVDLDQVDVEPWIKVQISRKETINPPRMRNKVNEKDKVAFAKWKGFSRR